MPHQIRYIDPRTRAAHDHHVGMLAANHVGRLAQRQQRRHIPLGNRIVRPARVVANADVARRHIRQILQHPQRIQLAHRLARPAVDIEILRLDPFDERNAQLFQIAVHHAGSADDAKAIRIERRLRQARILPGQLRRRRRELNIARHHLDAFPRLDQLLRIEVRDLAAERRNPTGRRQMRGGRTPLWRDWIAFHTASRPTPIGETMPTPVMTTSRSATLLPGQPENADDPTKITTEAKRARRQDKETRRRGDKEIGPSIASPCLLVSGSPCLDSSVRRASVVNSSQI